MRTAVQEDDVRCQDMVHPGQLVADPGPAVRADLSASVPVGPRGSIQVQQFVEADLNSLLLSGDGPPDAGIPSSLDKHRIGRGSRNDVISAYEEEDGVLEADEDDYGHSTPARSNRNLVLPMIVESPVPAARASK